MILFFFLKYYWVTLRLGDMMKDTFWWYKFVSFKKNVLCSGSNPFWRSKMILLDDSEGTKLQIRTDTFLLNPAVCTGCVMFRVILTPYVCKCIFLLFGTIFFHFKNASLLSTAKTWVTYTHQYAWTHPAWTQMEDWSCCSANMLLRVTGKT